MDAERLTIPTLLLRHATASPDLQFVVTEDEALTYQEAVAPNYPNGALLTPFPVPWRATDHSAEIRIG